MGHGQRPRRTGDRAKASRDRTSAQSMRCRITSSPASLCPANSGRNPTIRTRTNPPPRSHIPAQRGPASSRPDKWLHHQFPRPAGQCPCHLAEGASRSTQVFWPSNANSTWILEKLIAKKDNDLLAIGSFIQTLWAPPRRTNNSRHLQKQLPEGWRLALRMGIARLIRGEVGPGRSPQGRHPHCPSRAGLTLAGLSKSKGSSVERGHHSLQRSLPGSRNALCRLVLEHDEPHGSPASPRNGRGLQHPYPARPPQASQPGFRRRSIGSALLLAGSTTVAGFASLAFSSNSGIASLGMVCATGISISMLVAVYLLPVWWKALGIAKRKIEQE